MMKLVEEAAGVTRRSSTDFDPEKLVRPRNDTNAHFVLKTGHVVLPVPNFTSKRVRACERQGNKTKQVLRA